MHVKVVAGYSVMMVMTMMMEGLGFVHITWYCFLVDMHINECRSRLFEVISAVCCLFSAPDTFLLFSQRTSITRMLVNSGDSSPDVRLPVRGLKSIRALDFDPVDLVAYWIENQSKTIRRAADTAVDVST